MATGSAAGSELSNTVTKPLEDGSRSEPTGRLERVRRTANRRGVSTSRCAECRHVVRIGLLSEPNCPHCTAEFDAVVDRGRAGETTAAVVAKQRYCHRCQFFSSPPAVACRNPGIDNVELVDVDHFGVRNCSVVERRHGSAEALVEQS